MANYREIVTKAVIAKGKKLFTTNNTVKVDKSPSTILGCWVINHNFNGVKSGDNIRISGSYDVNIWYSYDNDTKTNVINQNIKYNEVIAVKTKLDVDFNDSEIIVRALKQPTCGNVQINGNTIDFEIEKELGIEVVGDTKVKIMVEDDEDKWEVFDDEATDDTMKEIDEEVNEDFLE